MELIDKEYQINNPEDISKIFPYLSKLFHTLDINHSITLAQFAITEFSLNAFKAIQKRIFFDQNNLDIQHPLDYIRGMEQFKKTVKFDEIDIKQLLHDHPGYHVTAKINQEKDGVRITIINNTSLLDSEFETIKNSLQSSENDELLHDPAYSNNDASEGAGIGLKMIQMMAKNMGFSPDIVSFRRLENETQFSIIIPLSLKADDDILTIITNKIAKGLTSVPILEQSLTSLIDSDYTTNLLLKDPGFLINYFLSKTSEPVSIENIFNGNVAKEFFNHHNSFTAISEKSELGKIYTEAIEISAIILVLDKMLHLKNSNVCRMAGLLCLLGNIVIASLENDLVEEIRELTNRQNPIVEEVPNSLSIGVNESVIGLSIAKKWKIPSEIVQSIQFHEKPWMSTKNDHVTATVHLALALNHLRKNTQPMNFDDTVLEQLGIKDKNLKIFYTRFIDYIDKKGKD